MFQQKRREYTEMMMVAFITFKSSLVPLIEGLCSSNPWELEFSGFRREREGTEQTCFRSEATVKKTRERKRE